MDVTMDSAGFLGILSDFIPLVITIVAMIGVVVVEAVVIGAIIVVVMMEPVPVSGKMVMLT